MKYLFCLSGDQKKASSRVRGYWIGKILEENGSSATLVSCQSKGSLFLFLFKILLSDVVIFQKVYSKWHCILIVFANLFKKTTIFDLDDAPSRSNNITTLSNVSYMMKHARYVTVGSQALFDLAKKHSSNVYLLPSSINLQYYVPDSRYKNTYQVCVGWIGNGSHYKDDLVSILSKPLTEIAKKHPVRFKIIGVRCQSEIYDAFSAIPELHVEFIDEIEWDNPKAVCRSMQDIDIGLYPLLPNEFNKFKCGFKALEYMAMKIPVISSNVAENRTIIQNGITGFFADTQEDWTDSLNKLICDYDLRKSMGCTGRKIVEKYYDLNIVVKQIQELSKNTVTNNS